MPNYWMFVKGYPSYNEKRFFQKWADDLNTYGVITDNVISDDVFADDVIVDGVITELDIMGRVILLKITTV